MLDIPITWDISLVIIMYSYAWHINVTYHTNTHITLVHANACTRDREDMFVGFDEILHLLDIPYIWLYSSKGVVPLHVTMRVLSYVIPYVDIVYDGLHVSPVNLPISQWVLAGTHMCNQRSYPNQRCIMLHRSETVDVVMVINTIYSGCKTRTVTVVPP